MSTYTLTENGNETVSLQLRAEASPSTAENFVLAQDYGLPADPNRLEAANNPNWDYRSGNPPNPIRGVVDISLRPNNATGFFFNTFIYVMFRGVSAIYTANRLWHHTGEKLNENLFRYKVAVEDPL